MTRCILRCVVAFLPIMLTSAAADHGHPVAVRVWPNGGVSVETMSNLHVGIRITPETLPALPRQPDLLLDSGKDSAELPKPSEPHELFRRINEPEIHFRPATDPSSSESDSKTAGSVTVETIAVGDRPLLRLSVDGVTIIDAARLTAEQLPPVVESDDDGLPRSDVLLVRSGSAEQLQRLLQTRAARTVIILNATEAGDAVTSVNHNTLAVSAAPAGPSEDTLEPSRLFSLNPTPWTMPDELADLFQKKEAASSASRRLFETLSTEQLNFRPSNGTHTPRWNTEHMMGRELLFFSQIYHAQDSAVPEMDLNPAQMPPDYQAAHPDWTGAEEARLTAAVEAFTRRFAYLLEGLDIDRRAPGSRFWTPRTLLMQMQRHYSEHTANVRKKTELPDWPKGSAQ